MTATLNRQPNIPQVDGFYESLIHAQRGMSDDQADLFLAKLVLILANQVGDRAVLDQAVQLARSNTLAV